MIPTKAGMAMVCAMLLAGCGRAPAPETPAPEPVAVPDAPTAGAPRYAVEPVPVRPSFERALERQTRTARGVPGPRYWQQEVDYRIDAELNPRTAVLQGAETITYINHSPDTLRTMVLHLYQNAFKQGVPRVREVPITGGITIEDVAVGGVAATPARRGTQAAPGRAAYLIDNTLMYVALPAPLPPGGTTTLDIGWHFTVPPVGAPRTGHIDHTVFNVAQWYPQVAVYDDVEGWHAWPYWTDGEFYLEYGDFDVSLTVPEGWVVGGTGVLQNPEEVLTDVARERLSQATRGDEVVRVVTADDLEAGNATQRAPGGQLTWRFAARDVRDFAFGASNRYLWDATRATVGDQDGDGDAETIPVQAYYRPETAHWREAARFTRHALEYHSRHWHPYIYPQMTSLEGPIGGMEYPMAVFVRDFPTAQTLYEVINHEAAHEWWPMMVGSKEPEYAWQDEGLATYVENLATMDLFPEARPFVQSFRSYARVAGTDYEKPMMRQADLYGPGPARVIASYHKPAVLLRALGAVVGEETVHRALGEYADRWLLRHPYALDFFNTVEDVAGRDLDWFWHPWWFETATLDHSLAEVKLEPAGGGERLSIVIDDQGDAPMPVLLAVTLASGDVRRVTVPVERWLAGGGTRRITETLEVAGPVARVEIDPEMLLPEVDRDDNVWVRP